MVEWSGNNIYDCDHAREIFYFSKSGAVPLVVKIIFI